VGPGAINFIKINKPDPTFQKCFCSCQGTGAILEKFLISFIDRKGGTKGEKRGTEQF
jgi:hypothetical protein